MLKISLWGFNKFGVQTELAYWQLSKITDNYVVSANFFHDDSMISYHLLETISFLENVENKLEKFPREIATKLKLIANTPQYKVIKINWNQSGFFKFKLPKNGSSTVFTDVNNLIVLNNLKLKIVNDLSKYLKQFLTSNSLIGYLVIQGDIYEIPKYLLNKQLFNVSNNSKPLTSIKDTSNIQTTGNSNTLNSLFS